MTPFLSANFQPWNLVTRFVNLQYRLCNLEWLGKQHAGVVPQCLVEQFLGVARDGRRAVWEIRVVVEVGEDVTGLGAKARLIATTAGAITR